MTEYSVKLENRELNTLNSALHYTYSIWPDSSIKKEVPYKFYQKRFINYNLKCEISPNEDGERQSREDFIKFFELKRENQEYSYIVLIE